MFHGFQSIIVSVLNSLVVLLLASWSHFKLARSLEPHNYWCLSFYFQDVPDSSGTFSAPDPGLVIFQGALVLLVRNTI